MYPRGFMLKRPHYCYDKTEQHVSTDKFRGLIKYGPYKKATVSRPRIAFAFTDEDRDHANQLYLAMRNGLDQFRGCETLVGLKLSKDQVERIAVPTVSDERQAQAFFEAIDDHLSKNGRPELAFIIHSKYPSPLAPDPYDWAKAALMKHGVPSQTISRELFKSRQQLSYALSNISVAMLAKLGGIPWMLATHGQRDLADLIIGIGRAEAPLTLSKHSHWILGFATCVLSSGAYVKTEFFPATTSEDEFISTLSIGLRQVVSRIIGQGERFGRVTVHVSHLLSRRVKDGIREATRHLADSEVGTPVEVIQVVGESDFMVVDQDHIGFVSQEGTGVELAPGHVLIVTEGRNETAVWRGRKPVTLELHRSYTSVSSLSMMETVEDAFWLSGVNWRGTNAVSQPISLQYAKLISKRIAQMSNALPDISSYLLQYGEVASAPWFL